MEKPVIYLYTKGGISDVLLCPAHIEIISRDEDAFDYGDASEEPLDRGALLELRLRNDEFELKLKKLLVACRKLTCKRDSLRDEGFAEIFGIIDAFEKF